ncbi:MAG: zinc-ribbon domain-containing protein [Lachnospiraceae bacterium]|nr:zinc-ribbon domain-containing protein [Lachnospiraceae bacterium]
MFCTKCGNQLKENARFCTKCGAPVRSKATAPAQPEPGPAPAVNATPDPAPVQSVQPTQTVPDPAPAPAVPDPMPNPAAAAEKTTAPEKQPAESKHATAETKPDAAETKPEIFKFHAPKAKGEAVLGTLKQKVSGAASDVIPGPGKEIVSSIKNYFTSLGAFFKNPLLMIPTLLFTLIIPGFWMLLNILQANGINPWPLKILSFLSCANGGMSGGIFGGFGGIIGKGVFVAGVVTLFSLIFRKKGGSKRSFGEILKGSFGVNRETLGVYFTGIGIAFLLYLFLTGGATRISALCGFAAMIITATSALNNGFVARLVNSVTAKGKHATGQAGAGLMRGFTVGYAASAILGFITGTRIIPVILAIHFLIAGAVFIILQLTGVIKPKKGVAV